MHALVVRRLIVIIMHSLISASTRRLIQVIPQIDIQLLPSAHIPRTPIRSIDARNAPLKIIATPRKRTVRVLALREADSERHAVDGTLLGYHSVKKLDRLAGRGDELNQLAADDLELTCCFVVAEEGGAGRVERVRLEVFVEVGGCDSADPVVAALECLAWSSACGGAGGGWCT